MRITESKLRSIIRKVILESLTDDQTAAGIAAEKGWDAWDAFVPKKKKGIRLKYKKRKSSPKKTGIKRKHYTNAPALSKIKKDIETLSVEGESYKPVVVNHKEDLWKSYYKDLSERAYAFNVGGGGNRGVRGLVAKINDKILFVPFNNVDKIFNVNSKSIRRENIIKLTGGDQSAVKKAEAFFNDENNKPMNKVEDILKALEFKRVEGQ
jgi:hypothetical protein